MNIATKQINILFALLVAIYVLVLCSDVSADRPCAPRQIPNRSVVCVCNETYCDDITRDVPCSGQYVTYTSSASGSRFKKNSGSLVRLQTLNRTGEYIIDLDPTVKYQEVKGFGGAVTDSAAINWKSLPKKMQQYLIDSYFSNRGIEYNIIRVPIGCSDFSVRHYTYDDWVGDDNLEKFSLQKEDYQYKIPMIKEIFKVATDKVFVIGSSWTPPRWMKYKTPTNPQCGFLKKEYYQAFANYLLKFVESYDKEGIDIWALTTSNEPSLAVFVFSLGSCLGWATKDMGQWIVENFGPTIRNSNYKDIKLLGLDDQRYTIKIVFDQMVQNNSKVLDYLDGLAVHYYANNYVSPGVVTYATSTYNLFVISTEASAGIQIGVTLGSWKNAMKYIKDLIQDLANYVVGWVDWNLCLNRGGGPNVDLNFVDSPIIVDSDKKEFYKQPMYYALGHISKFVCRGSFRIKSSCPHCSCCIANVAFLTPSNTIVVIVHNVGEATSVTLRQGRYGATIDLEADSITTVELRTKW